MEVHSSMGWIILSILGTALLTRGQIANQNVLSETIPMALRQCYNSSYIVVKDNLLPMTTTNLIALLRKIEDSSYYSMNSRLMAPAVLLKYRYDGIQRIPDLRATQYVKPYARSGKEYYLYKLQMNKIIPVSSSSVIPDDTLSDVETCTLHSMLSLSIDKYDRGDNDEPCSRLSKYSQWNSRFPRDLSKTRDAEYIWPNYDSQMTGDYQQYVSSFQPAAGSFQAAISQCPMENGVVYDRYGTLSPGIVIAGLAAGLNYQSVPYNSYFVQPRNGGRKVQTAVDHYRSLFASQPPGNGKTNRQGAGYPQRPQDYDYAGAYGTGNGYGQGSNGYGQGVNGYGAGSQGGYAPNAGSNGYGAGHGSNVGNGYGNNGNSYGNNGANRFGNNGGSGYGNANGNGGGINNPYGTNLYGQVDIDGKYAATLAGMVALESLLQGPENLITIGGRGGWNSSSLPKYYFLQNWITDSVLTDARIRGGADGLFLASNVQSWTSVGGDIKLSQILDAYYSDRGLFSSDVKACNRKNRFSQYAPQLNQQAYALSYMLNNDLPPGALIGSDGVSTFADYASTQTSTYVASLPGNQCPYNASAPSASPNADITIVIDCNWPFSQVAGIFNYLAEQCNFWKYGSNLTIISGKDGAVLAESVQSPLDIPRNYNQTVIGGFDFPKVLSQLKIRFQNRLQSSAITQSAGGLPHIVIFVPMTISMSDSDKNNARDTMNYFRYSIPDVRFLYVVTGNKDMWTPFAYNPDKDIIVSPQGSDLVISLQPLIQRIASIPRRLINPNCGGYFNGGSYNQVSLDGYLSPNEINYYRIHQNYFFKSGTNAVVTIASKSYNSPTLMICQSRNNPLPSRNVTGSGNVNCQQLTSSNTVVFNINDVCSSDYYAAACDPYYFSIYNTQIGSSINSNGATCKDPQCRFPDQTKYTISHTGFTCYSNANQFASSVLLVSILWTMVTFRS